ncbi:MAG: tRNA epoxyqueuosine(34) reductase QueG [Prevotellaceae bacterium]|nr:tRNA epoxyqueuosine(34) reductase QueG [Prevotellaceae bacterium]
MNSRLSNENIKAEARRLGFFACGLARADAVDSETAAHVRQWLDHHDYASMEYMANYTDKRLDPRLLVDGVHTIVSVAMNYAPAQRLPEGQPQMAAYALGQDYHDLVKDRLRQLAAAIGAADGWRAFCDSAPVLERYWAVKAGLGWTGRNHQLIIPHAGSMFFLGELFLQESLEPDEPMVSRCGTCHRCIDACPTHALTFQGEMDAERCLSYQLIENRGELSDLAKEKMGDCFYGCDRCQTACPWNRFATPTTEPALQPKPELLHMTREDWQHLSVEDYRRLFKGSAVKRAKYEGLKRNIDSLNPLLS